MERTFHQGGPNFEQKWQVSVAIMEFEESGIFVFNFLLVAKLSTCSYN